MSHHQAIMPMLHLAVLSGCIGLSAMVMLSTLYTLVRFRRHNSEVSTHFHQRFGVELLWTMMPFMLLILLAIPAVEILYKHHHPQTQIDKSKKSEPQTPS